VITLTPSIADEDYLGVGNIVGTVTGNVGRFIPHHFETVVSQVAGVPMTCPIGVTCTQPYNGFVYSGQPFTVNVTANDVDGNVTTNYGGSAGGNGFAKAVTLSAASALGGSAIAAISPGGAITSASASVAADAFVNGSSAAPGAPATPAFLFAAAPTAATNIYVRAVESTGGDGTTSLRLTTTDSVEGGVTVVSGRIKVLNGYGSEQLALPLRATIQYYSATGWVDSLTDSVTTLVLPASFSLTKNGSATGTTLATLSPATGVVSAGRITINLAKPSSGATGTATVLPTGPSFLLSGSNAAAVNQSISGLATFGLFKSKLIYRRENY
jgi:MSHA biogenesis protein MshQ